MCFCFISVYFKLIISKYNNIALLYDVMILKNNSSEVITNTLLTCPSVSVWYPNLYIIVKLKIKYQKL